MIFECYIDQDFPEHYYIHKRVSHIDVWILLEYLRILWKDGIIHDDNNQITPIEKASSLKLFQEKMFVVYKDMESMTLWDKYGYSQENAPTAMYIVFDNDCIHITYAENHKKMFDEIAGNLFANHNRFQCANGAEGENDKR